MRVPRLKNLKSTFQIIGVNLSANPDTIHAGRRLTGDGRGWLLTGCEKDSGTRTLSSCVGARARVKDKNRSHWNGEGSPSGSEEAGRNGLSLL
jgi:hypothetical protein